MKFDSSRLLVCVVQLVAAVLLLLQGCGCSELKRALRRRRNLLYPDPGESETKVQVLFGLGLPMEGEVSMTLGYVLKCNYNLPHNSSDYTRPAGRDTADDGERRFAGLSRWSLYRMLERAWDKGCVLRAVCEAAEANFRGGLLAELLQLLLTPSTSDERYDVYSDREYAAAEARGRLPTGGCEPFQRLCPRSPLAYFTHLLP